MGWFSKMLGWESNTGKWEDPEFPANAESLGEPDYIKDESPEVKWLRPGEFQVGDHGCTPFSLFPADGISPDDVCQKYLGDCWLLSALSTLASKPTLIKKVFLCPRNDETGEPCIKGTGKYIIQIYDVRAQKTLQIPIDDRIPCVKDEDTGLWAPLGVTLQKGAIWPALLEKAIAKFFGSYAAIEGGWSDWPLAVFTGHVSGEFYCSDELDNTWYSSRTVHSKLPAAKASPSLKRVFSHKPGEVQLSTGALFTTLRGFIHNPDFMYLVGAGSRGHSDKHSCQGVVLGHAYGVLDIIPVTGTTLLKLRNPWGVCEWEGAWSDGDEHWDMHPEIAAQVGYEAKEDGQFFMSTEDFVKMFNDIYYVRLPKEKDQAEASDDEDDFEDEEDEVDEFEYEADENEDDDDTVTVEELFYKFDLDGSRTLSTTEMLSGLVYEMRLTKPQARKVINKFDKDGDGEFAFDEFKAWFDTVDWVQYKTVAY